VGNLGRFLLFALAGLGVPMLFAGLAAVLNGRYALGALLIAVSLASIPVWLRLRGTFR
jgi:hypothetical protein